jgi:hypothetical protein
MNILDLPIEILAIITTADLTTFLAALKTPGIGPRLCCEYVQNHAKNAFTRIYKYQNNIRYYLAGRLHRDDGPAVIYSDGDFNYYRFGRLHREDGHACFINGNKHYYINGKIHREDGPATIYHNGCMRYYVNDRLHREDGPALIDGGGYSKYYIHGVECSEIEFIILGYKI